VDTASDDARTTREAPAPARARWRPPRDRADDAAAVAKKTLTRAPPRVSGATRRVEAADDEGFSIVVAEALVVVIAVAVAAQQAAIARAFEPWQIRCGIAAVRSRVGRARAVSARWRGGGR